MSEDKNYNQRILVGCGLAFLSIILLIGGLLVTAVYFDRETARFPGAETVSTHSNYSRLPNQFRWDDTYLITDENFRTVYTWYSLKFDLGAEAEAIERCILLEGTDRWMLAERYVGILLCETPAGHMAFVNRTTYLP